MSVILYAVHKIPGVIAVIYNFKHFCTNAKPNTEYKQSLEYLCRTFVFFFGS